MDLQIYNIMMGTTYQHHGISDNESSLSSETNIDLTYNSDDEIPIKELKTVSIRLKNEIDSSSKCSSNLSTPLVSHTNSTSLFDRESDNSEEDDDDYPSCVTKEFIDIDESSKMDVFNDEQKAKILLPTHDGDGKLMSPHDVCDSSDETSSRGTLDLIIPPPKNFQGINNPFHNDNQNNVKKKKAKQNKTTSGNNFNEGSVSDSGKKNKRKQINNGNVNYGSKAQNISTDLVGNMAHLNNEVPVNNKNNNGVSFRIVKRRLSAKDILIGPNQEVKRRRIRRRSGHIEVNKYTISQNTYVIINLIILF